MTATGATGLGEATYEDLHDDGWAILAPPPGERDLALPEYCDRSLARSLRRREAAAARRASVKKGLAPKVSAALVAATLVAPVTQVSQAQATTATAVGTGLLKKGSRGPAVAAVQRALGITADGVFGPQTKAAVLAYQQAHGLEVDGIVGPQTLGALGTSGTSTLSSTSPTSASGSGVAQLQQALGISADGVYGPQTRAAVSAYQQAHGLAVDGVAGPQTLGALGLSGVTVTVPRTVSSTSGTTTSGSGALAAVSAARSKIGAPYVYAGVGPTGYDCSGLTQYAMRQAGVYLPRTSYAQFGVGTPVTSSSIQAGDLVFFNTSGAGASHVGIATSATTVISATSHGVMEHSIFDSYWGAHYVGARRVA
jgi:cell wall-associated NlpC family hydrolase